MMDVLMVMLWGFGQQEEKNTPKGIGHLVRKDNAVEAEWKKRMWRAELWTPFHFLKHRAAIVH